MPVNLQVSASTLLAFLLVLARMLGVFIFVPLPFKDAGPNISSVVLALGCAIALYPRWPLIDASSLTLSSTIALMASDAMLGASIGLMVSFLSEAFTVGAQSLALQAGYGYASVIDPTTQADSDVLAVLVQMLTSLFFFTANLHLVLVKIFADSLVAFPPGHFALTQNLAREVIRLGSGIFAFGLRLALPIISLLLMTELTLALLGRISTQLQLGTHAFPVKMMLSLAALSSVLVVTPKLYESYAEQVFSSLHRSFLR
jgi:flagellar biosynthetic protein FliR